jgi:hypothetical protein
MAKRSPVSLSLEYLHKLGWVCHIVEKRLPIPGKHITQDCFGFGDILAYSPRGHQGQPALGIALIQTTSWGNFSTRHKKIQANGHFESWKRAGGRIFLHGWGENGLREEEL